MSSTAIIQPMPSPSKTYDPMVENNRNRVINQNFAAMGATGASIGTTLQYTQLPTSPTGLAKGMIWCDTANSNVLKVIT